jgi:ribonuclease P protein component
LADAERFRQVRETGKSYAHPLVILCALRSDEEISRCGFTASRRLGNAVARNRARRRMREAVRLAWDLIEPGWDLVWIARPALAGADFVELQAACVRLLRRAGALRPEARADSAQPADGSQEAGT